jgi:hypothetical protein
MTQQSEADGREDGAAQDRATHGSHKNGQDQRGGGKAGPGRANGKDPLLTQRLSLQPKGATSAWTWTDMARLESVFPAFSFAIWKGWDGPRFEAWRDATPDGMYAIITDDPRELWRELEMVPR